jgi:hypothetical protein
MVLAASAPAFVACGDDSSRTSDNAGRGGSGGRGLGEAGAGDQGGGGNEGSGLPTRLPSSTAECASATGAEGCYFDACCAELVACAESPACATTYGCYTACPDSDANCFPNCAGAALQEGAEAFGAALGCVAPLLPSCGQIGGGTGGTGGTGGAGGGAGTGGTSPDVGPLGTASDELGWDLNVSDNPLIADVELETDAAVSETITVDGGTLTATAASGVTFELTIPEGAVYGPTVITLTPLASLTVPELEGPAYGVQIEPDGLELMESPMLRITPPDGEEWPLDEQLPLSISGADRSVALALVDPALEPLELVLTHFSYYAVLLSEKGVGATLSDVDIKSRFGGDVAERMQSAAAERTGRERVSQILGMGSGIGDVGKLLGEMGPEYEEFVIKPRLAKAGESCAAGKLALQTVLGYTRQKQLMGVGQEETWFVDVFPTVAEVCVKEEYELCRDHHIITRVLNVLMSMNRQAQLRGLSKLIEEGAWLPPAWLADAEENVKKCLKFELRFDSDVLLTDTVPDTTMRETVTATVPIAMNVSFTTIPASVLPGPAADIGALIMGGPAPLTSTAYSVSTQEPCRTINDEIAENGELYVVYLSFLPGITTDETPGGSPEVFDFSVALALSPNLSKYAFTQQYDGGTEGCEEVLSSGEAPLSWSTTLATHLFTSNASDEGALFETWDIQPPDSGSILAVKDLAVSGTDTNQTSRGPVNMVLLHTPDP